MAMCVNEFGKTSRTLTFVAGLLPLFAKLILNVTRSPGRYFPSGTKGLYTNSFVICRVVLLGPTLSAMAQEPCNPAIPFMVHAALSAPAAIEESTYPLETCGIGVVEIGDHHKVK